MTTYEQDLQAISIAMGEPGLSPEEVIERRVDFLVRELDELCGMANDANMRRLILQEAIGIGQIHSRAGLILSFLEAHKQPKFKVISNG